MYFMDPVPPRGQVRRRHAIPTSGRMQTELVSHRTWMDAPFGREHQNIEVAVGGSQLETQEWIDLLAIGLALLIAAIIGATAVYLLCSFGSVCYMKDVIVLFAVIFLPALWIALKIRKKIDWPKDAFRPVRYRSEKDTPD